MSLVVMRCQPLRRALCNRGGMEEYKQYRDAINSIRHYAVNNKFSKSCSENYLCPSCKSQTLSVDWKTITSWHTRKSKLYMDECRDLLLGWDNEESELQFIGRLICECGEVIAISGNSKYQEEVESDGSGEQYKFVDEKYEIKYFSRAIQTFYAPDNTPSQCVRILEEAFQLFHLNQSASGNRLRVLLEFIVDDLLGSESQKINKLNDKIGRLNKLMPDIKGLADLNRILGNLASHKNGLSYDDLTSAFYFVDHLLQRAYGEQYKMLRFMLPKSFT
ncbi:DUF4145 domain-containing protein [Vibrio cholerae]|nr:DUF4145 domain-containing protein [Vibrio cholerae]